MYDAEGLLAALREAGFDARPHAPFVSRIPDIRDVEDTARTDASVIAEAVVGPAT
jgi:hypothetical protein